jgi:hypothetical protein
MVEHLSFGLSRQDQLGLFDHEWKVGSYGRRVVADPGPQLGIPEVRIVDWGRSMIVARYTRIRSSP